MRKYNLNGHLTKEVEYMDDAESVVKVSIHYSDQINPNKMYATWVNIPLVGG